ncbi:MAG: hypothetical protein ACTSUC_04215 [Promethearchaeota archaeon]
MSMYDESGIGDFFYVLQLNSYLFFKMFREFFNGTVNIQINDLRKMPTKFPSKEQLDTFQKLFNNCLAIKIQYFQNEIDRSEANSRLYTIERKIDDLVNQFYGITESIVIEDIEENNELVEMELDEENKKMEREL